MGLAELIERRPDIAPWSSVEYAARVMAAHNVGALLVMDDDLLVGIFTERDVLNRVVAVGKDPATTAVREVMSAPVQGLPSSTPIEEAAERMRLHHIRHLAVFDDEGELRGLVSQRRLLDDFLGGLERRVNDLESFIMTDGPGG
jgi:CBS domain-containing protein